MLFTDPLFLFLFLPLFLAGFAVLTRLGGGRYRTPLKLFVLVSTLVFYGWRHRPAWWLPFVAAVAFDFLWSKLLVSLEGKGARRLVLVASIAQNVTLLLVYKYLSWILGFDAWDGWTPAERLRAFWLDANGLQRYEMPAGISFYLFESMSYVIDVYRRVVVPPRNPLDFFSFIAMFPRMIAGPIVRYAQVVGQMAAWPGMRVRRGLPLFMLGFVYKALFADSFALFTTPAFGVPAPGALGAWLGVVCYAFQLYFDFAGYSLMAIGLGHCIGFHFPTNFANPYAALSISDFWRRWHISLSTWLRDYLYVPLGGNRRGPLRRDLNLMATMALGGLWHGANLTFLAWGVFHGALLVAERATTGLRARLPPLLLRALTFGLVLVGWTIFRADDLPHAGRVLAALAGAGGLGPEAALRALARHPFSAAWLVPAGLYALWWCPRLSTAPEDREAWPPLAEGAIAVLFVLAVLLTLTSRLVPFLYFQF
jgi:alginate O-acetyltransferase complex protein AlgI